MTTTSEISGAKLLQSSQSIVLPATDIARVIASKDLSKKVIIRAGGGLIQNGATLRSTKAGILSIESSRNKIWIENNQKRYVPALHDKLIAIIIERHTDEYRLDINATDTATLPALAFEGATKKNKPNLSIGCLVYCRVTRASRNMETELSCIEPGSNKSWVGGETKYGELKAGNLVRVSLALSRSLMRYKSYVLNLLGNKFQFQCAVGANGRVWIESQSIDHTIVLSIAIKNADTMDKEEWTKSTNILIDRTINS